MLRRGLAVLLLLTSGAQVARAQEVAEVTLAAVGVTWLALGVGAVIRVADVSHRATIGDKVQFDIATGNGAGVRVDARIASVSSDSIAVDVNGAPASFARRDVAGMRGYLGRESKWAQGWLTGFVLGGGGLGLAGLATGDDVHCSDFCFTAGENGVLGLAVGGVAGSLLGAAIGTAFVGERWAPVNRIEASRVTVAPLIGRQTGLNIGVAL